MTTYVIGDVQGCYRALRALLDEAGFKSDRDCLWFTGDLVNRGPLSLKTLRFIHDLGDNAITVLGNHDLHLLAVAWGVRTNTDRDNLDDILSARDADTLIEWLSYRPLLHHDEDTGFTLVHAGLAPQWDFSTAIACAQEMHEVLRSNEIGNFLANMYGNQPDIWDEDLSGWDRLRFITNTLTRIRYCDREGRMDFRNKREPGSQPEHLMPWFEVPERLNKDMKIVFGHWASLGLYQARNIFALDSGCVWGGHLTAMKIGSTPRFFQIRC